MYTTEYNIPNPPIACQNTMLKDNDNHFCYFRITLKADEMAIGGFGNLKMDYIRVVRHFGLKDVKVSVRLRADLKIAGNYILNGTALGILPVTGDGDFSINAKEVEISAVTYLIMNDKMGKDAEEKKKIVVQNLDAQIGYKELDFKFQNLMGGGVVGSTVNIVINAVGEAIVENQRKQLIMLFKTEFHNWTQNLI